MLTTLGFVRLHQVGSQVYPGEARIKRTTRCTPDIRICRYWQKHVHCTLQFEISLILSVFTILSGFGFSNLATLQKPLLSLCGVGIRILSGMA